MMKKKIAIHLDGILRDKQGAFEKAFTTDVNTADLLYNPLWGPDLKKYFPSPDLYYEFMEEYTLEIYGNADPVDSGAFGSNGLNSLQDEFNGTAEFTLISEDQIKARSATFNFLCKSLCFVERVHFITSFDQLSEYDVLVATDPLFLDNFSGVKVKLKSGYNDKTEADFTVNSSDEIQGVLREFLKNEK